MSEKSLYQILGVSPDASQADIRTAYLKLAKEWHPDRNPGNGAEAERRFKEIAHAYDVLSDPDKRAAYDAAAGTGEHTAGFEGTMDEDAAFDLFISVLLDLAFELAENGADQITIYQALIDMGCPSGTAKTLAQRAHKLGGNGKAGESREDASKAKRQGNHGNGGGANGGNKDASTAASEPIDPDATFPAGPWSRWFARSLDLLVGATVASPLIGWLFQWLWSLEPAPLRVAAYVVLITPLPFLVDAIIVGMFGNSLGKALLKIRVVTKTVVDGKETVHPIGFEDVGPRNAEIWLKGYWCSIPILAAVPQFLVYLKVSEGKQVSWDMGPNYQSVAPSEADDLSAQSIPQKQKFFVQRQKMQWELIAAFVVCVIAVPIVGGIGAELFVGSFPVLKANDSTPLLDATATDAAAASEASTRGDDSPEVLKKDGVVSNMDGAINAAFPSGLNYIYKNFDNSACNNLLAQSRIIRLIRLNSNYEALISTVRFDENKASHACMGFTKIDILQLNEKKSLSIKSKHEIYSYGWGQPDDDLKIEINKGSWPTLTLRGGYTAQGYTSSETKVYNISPSGASLISQNSECSDPDGNIISGPC